MTDGRVIVMIRRRVLLAAAVLGAAFGAVAGAPSAHACSCVATTDAEAFARADAVFVGDIVGRAVVDAPFAEGPAQPEGAAVWSFRVREVYKGSVPARAAVATSASGASCGLELPHEGTFLMFARRGGDAFEPSVAGVGLNAGLCDGARPVADAPVPAAFGPPRRPEGAAPTGPGSGDEEDGGGFPVVGAGAIAAAAATMAVIGALAARRRRR